MNIDELLADDKAVVRRKFPVWLTVLVWLLLLGFPVLGVMAVFGFIAKVLTSFGDPIPPHLQTP